MNYLFFLFFYLLFSNPKQSLCHHTLSTDWPHREIAKRGSHWIYFDWKLQGPFLFPLFSDLSSFPKSRKCGRGGGENFLEKTFSKLQFLFFFIEAPPHMEQSLTQLMSSARKINKQCFHLFNLHSPRVRRSETIGFWANVIF